VRPLPGGGVLRRLGLRVRDGRRCRLLPLPGSRRLLIVRPRAAVAFLGKEWIGILRGESDALDGSMVFQRCVGGKTSKSGASTGDKGAFVDGRRPGVAARCRSATASRRRTSAASRRWASSAASHRSASELFSAAGHRAGPLGY